MDAEAESGVKKLFIPETAAYRFFTDRRYSFKARCSHCHNEAKIKHLSSKADLPQLSDSFFSNIGYPTFGKCFTCGKTLLVGYKD